MQSELSSKTGDGHVVTFTRFKSLTLQCSQRQGGISPGTSMTYTQTTQNCCNPCVRCTNTTRSQASKKRSYIESNLGKSQESILPCSRLSPTVISQKKPEEMPTSLTFEKPPPCKIAKLDLDVSLETQMDLNPQMLTSRLQELSQLEQDWDLLKETSTTLETQTSKSMDQCTAFMQNMEQPLEDTSTISVILLDQQEKMHVSEEQQLQESQPWTHNKMQLCPQRDCLSPSLLTSSPLMEMPELHSQHNKTLTQSSSTGLSQQHQQSLEEISSQSKLDCKSTWESKSFLSSNKQMEQTQIGSSLQQRMDPNHC